MHHLHCLVRHLSCPCPPSQANTTMPEPRPPGGLFQLPVLQGPRHPVLQERGKDSRTAHKYVAAPVSAVPLTFTDPCRPAHCIDTIRQVLMCNVDTRLMGQVWYDKEHPRPFPDFSTRHTCKNYDVVRSWAKEREVCATQVSLARTCPDIYHRCQPPTSCPKTTRGGQITWMMFFRTRDDRGWRSAYTDGVLMAELAFRGLVGLGNRFGGKIPWLHNSETEPQKCVWRMAYRVEIEDISWVWWYRVGGGGVC